MLLHRELLAFIVALFEYFKVVIPYCFYSNVKWIISCMMLKFEVVHTWDDTKLFLDSSPVMTVFQAHLLELIVVSTLIQGNCTQAGEKVRGLILDISGADIS